MPFFVPEKNHYIFNKKQTALLKLKIILKYNKKNTNARCFIRSYTYANLICVLALVMMKLKRFFTGIINNSQIWLIIIIYVPP